MKRIVLVVLVMVLAVACNSGEKPSKQEVSEYPVTIKGSFTHTVLIWLKNPDSQEDRIKFETEVKAFLYNSEFAKEVHIGTPAHTEREIVDSSYTYSLLVTFDSKEDQDAYQKEPVHLKFVEECEHLWNKVLIYDSIGLKK